MKKLTLLILVLSLTLPLLCACANTGDGGNDTSDGGEPAFTLPLPSLNDPDEPETETETPTLPEYGYLADAKFDTDEFLPEYDMDMSFIQHSSVFYPMCATDEKAFAYLYESGLIVTIDKATGDSAPLCTKSDCVHNGIECDAYVGDSCYGLRVYEGRLSWVAGIWEYGTPLQFVSCDLDGTDRRSEILDNGSYDYCAFFQNFSYDMSVFIHRGYIYFAGMYTMAFAGMPEYPNRYTVATMPIGGTPVIIFQETTLEDSAPLCYVKPVGNDLYIMVFREFERGLIDMYNKSSVPYSRDSWGSEKLQFFRWSAKTREIEMLYESTFDTPMLSVDSKSFLPVPEDGIYFQKIREYQREDGTYDSTATLCKYSFETGEAEDIAALCDGDFDSFFRVSFTDDYIVAQSYGNMYAFDYEGNLALKHELLSEYESPLLEVAGADGEYIYYYCETDEESFYLAVPRVGGGPMKSYAAHAPVFTDEGNEDGGQTTAYDFITDYELTLNIDGKEHKAMYEFHESVDCWGEVGQFDCDIWFMDYRGPEQYKLSTFRGRAYVLLPHGYRQNVVFGGEAGKYVNRWNRVRYAEHYLYNKTVYEFEFKLAGETLDKRMIQKHQLGFEE